MTENNSFTPEEKEKIRKIKNEIDLTDSQMLLQYGAGAKQNIATFPKTSSETYGRRTPDM